MATPDRLRIRVIRLAAASLAAGVLAVWMLQTDPAESALPSPSRDALTAPIHVPEARSPVASRTAAPATPRALTIPALSVSASIGEVGLTAAGDLDVPPPGRPSEAGWYTGGPTPGDPGRAVVIGHVDTADGRGVFYRLATLNPADQIDVARSDGRVATFRVDGIRVYSKDAFPAAAVFAPSTRAELILITCGGSLDSRSGYSFTVLVYAHLADISGPKGQDASGGASADAAARLGANLLVLALSAGVMFAFWKSRRRRRR